MCFANIYCHWDHLNLSQFFTPICEIGITLPHKNNKANQLLIDSFQIGCYDRKQNEWVDLCINPNNHDKQYFIKVELRVMADDNSVCMCCENIQMVMVADTPSWMVEREKERWRLLFAIFPYILWKYLFHFPDSCEGQVSLR